MYVLIKKDSCSVKNNMVRKIEVIDQSEYQLHRLRRANSSSAG